MDRSGLDELLDEQRRYYRERAPEYDDWWERRGRYDGGPGRAAAWRAEIGVVADWLARCQPRGAALELAAGTGNWTRRLAPLVDRLLAIDASGETLAVAATKIPAADLDTGRVELRAADIFTFEPEQAFDTVFFSFWLTHVPDSLLEPFWALVARSLAPGGQVLFVDNAAPSVATDQGGSTLDVHYAAGADDVDGTRAIARRTLADGRTFHIVKRFWEPGELANRLNELGWKADITTTEHYFLHGRAVPAAPPAS